MYLSTIKDAIETDSSMKLLKVDLMYFGYHRISLMPGSIALVQE